MNGRADAIFFRCRAVARLARGQPRQRHRDLDGPECQARQSARPDLGRGGAGSTLLWVDRQQVRGHRRRHASPALDSPSTWKHVEPDQRRARRAAHRPGPHAPIGNRGLREAARTAPEPTPSSRTSPISTTRGGSDSRTIRRPQRSGRSRPRLQKVVAHWIVSAKQETTRDKRLAELIEDCAAGRLVKFQRYGTPPAWVAQGRCCGRWRPGHWKDGFVSLTPGPLQRVRPPALGAEDPAHKRADRDDFARDRAVWCTRLRCVASPPRPRCWPRDDDFVRNRLTHSLEVAQIGREFGAVLGCNADVVDSACLAHDLGHPPSVTTGDRPWTRLPPTSVASRGMPRRCASSRGWRPSARIRRFSGRPQSDPGHPRRDDQVPVATR